MAKNTKEKEISRIDIHNETLMINLGIHPMDVTPRDPEVWTKSPKEKSLVKKFRRKYRHLKMSPGVKPFKVIPFYDKLIVNIQSNKEFTFKDKHNNTQMKTTYAFKCAQSDIPSILSKFTVNKNGHSVSLVKKYYWNGYEYNPDVLPFAIG